MALGRVNTGGGGSGGTLVITGVAGDTVTAAKSGKTYSRTFNSSGIATFKGLATGTWAITMTDGSQSVTQNVTINADYSLTMAYFSALITTTWPEGSTCSCTDGTSTLYAPDTSGSYTFNVPNKGTWTVSCTNGTKTSSKSVTITADGQTEKIELMYAKYLINYAEYDSSYTWAWGNNAVNSNAPTNVKGTASFGNNGLEVCKNDSTTVNATYGAKKVDLTEFSTLHYNITTGEGTMYWFYLGIFTDANTAWSNQVVANLNSDHSLASSTTYEDLSLDISALSGEYLVGFAAYTSLKNMVIHQLWLE